MVVFSTLEELIEATAASEASRKGGGVHAVLSPLLMKRRCLAPRRSEIPKRRSFSSSLRSTSLLTSETGAAWPLRTRDDREEM